MAISPPSDLILDVVRAADPASVRKAQQSLMAHSTSPAAATAAFEQSFDAARLAGGPDGGNAESTAPDDAALRKSYQSFEAMMLQSFVKSMLPSDTEGFFGEGTAGEMWKSMMAEQLGTMIAKGGGIGIVDQMLAEKVTAVPDGGTIQAKTDGNDRNLATSLLHELEMDALGGWTGDEVAESAGPFG